VRDHQGSVRHQGALLRTLREGPGQTIEVFADDEFGIACVANQAERMYLAQPAGSRGAAVQQHGETFLFFHANEDGAIGAFLAVGETKAYDQTLRRIVQTDNDCCKTVRMPGDFGDDVTDGGAVNVALDEIGGTC